MADFFSPILQPPGTDPQSWGLSLVEEVVIPAGLRYAGDKLRGVTGSPLPGGSVVIPAPGVLRKITGAGKTFVELQVTPFKMRRVAAAFAWGLPTFYLVFDDASKLVSGIQDNHLAGGGEPLSAGTQVTVVCAFQDRVVLDPTLWTRRIGEAISSGGGDVSKWQPFVEAVARIIPPERAPVLMLNHAGQPLKDALVEVVFDPPTRAPARVTLLEEDKGDLQKAAQRLGHSPLWVGNSSLRLRSLLSPSDTPPLRFFQLARLEDGETSGGNGEIEVRPEKSHVLLTNLHEWFAEQKAIPDGQTQPPLQRFTRGNLITPLINGPEYFHDLFAELKAAQNPDGGFHLAGWSMFAQTKLTKRRPSEVQDLELTRIAADREAGPDEIAVTLEQAAYRIGQQRPNNTVSCCFLLAKFIQLDPDVVEILLFLSSFGDVSLYSRAGIPFLLVDGLGELVRVILWGRSILPNPSDPQFLEPHKKAFETLQEVPGSRIHFAPFPALPKDNPLVPQPLPDEFPFDPGFEVMRHFGVYHEKFAVVRTALNRYIGYCGGIDLKPNRLDDANHLADYPYHDVHARVEGPAVRDLALTFEHRWQRDGRRPDGQLDPLAFQTPSAASLGIGARGRDIVQVARTYFRPDGPPDNHLHFSPQGERTIADTMINAIKTAREFIYIEDQYFTPPAEYRQALRDKVSRGEIRKLVIALPVVTDQPFGDYLRSSFISELREADKDERGVPRGIVQIGYPRRRFTIPDNDLRSSSGKCILGHRLTAGVADGTIVLGPKDRLPEPPFWVAVEGELMWVYAGDETLPDGNRKFLVDRGTRTGLIKGGGATMREHAAGAAVTVVHLSSITVHAKLMIVDDIFMCIGSANINRRGLFHDGEINAFTIPQALKTAPNNPVAKLRARLWAEMLDLPADIAAPLLRDPLAAAKLFERSPLAGNRFVDIDAHPTNLLVGNGVFNGFTTLMILIQLLLAYTILDGDDEKLFDYVVDPTSKLEPQSP